MERKTKRTIISIQEYQPRLDFEEAERSPPFTFPEYQRSLIGPRIAAGVLDFSLVAVIYLIFVLATVVEMPADITLDRRVVGIYGAGYLLLLAVYFFLFMLSASQTPGMKIKELIVVTKEGTPLNPHHACMRGFGYLISIFPIMLGFVWMLIDPEHLTWADKVSTTYVKKA